MSPFGIDFKTVSDDPVLNSACQKGQLRWRGIGVEERVISKISRTISDGGDMTQGDHILNRLWRHAEHGESRDAVRVPRRREKCSARALFLAIMIFTFGLFSIAMGILEVYTSAHMEEAWAPALWELFARSGLMLFTGMYALLDIAIGSVFVVCSYSIFRVKHMEFAALTALVTGLVALFVYGIGEWWTYVNQTKYEGLGAMFMRVLIIGALPMIAGVLSLTAQREEAKTVMGKRIRGFWTDFSHNKIGLAGAAMLLAYIAAAVLAPVLSLDIDPNTTYLADDNVPPEWLTAFYPSMSNLPRTSTYIANWSQASLDMVPEYIRTNPNFTWSIDEGSFVLNISSVMVNETTPLFIALESSPINYPYDPPRGGGFNIAFEVKADPREYWIAYNEKNQSYLESGARSKYNIEMNLTTPTNTLSIWDADWSIRQLAYYMNGWSSRGLEPINMSSADKRLTTSRQLYMTVLSTDLLWCYRMNFVSSGGGPDPRKLSEALFEAKGNYSFRTYIFVAPLSASTQKPVYFYLKVTPVRMFINGMLWGLMGTDWMGHDVWSRVVFGVKMSLTIGLVAAVFSSLVGILVGVVAGYMGGPVDMLLMRSVDVMLALPMLPLLIVLVTKFGPSIWFIVLMIASFGWQGLARVVRSHVLSLREASFVECATSSGASRTYIMIRHIVPNILPIVMSDFVLSVPGAIMTEASLSFIGFGDPAAPTWGREFSDMWIKGGAFAAFAWWWIIPPALAITMLCLAFVLLGNSLDEIVNPKSRRRR